MFMSNVQPIYQPRGWVWRRKEEGWKEEEGEGSLRDKFVPKKRFTQLELAQTRTGDYSLS